MKSEKIAVAILLWIAATARAEVTRHAGSAEALPDQKYIHVVSETDSPVMQTWIKAKDGLYIAAAVRKPSSSKWGNVPLPAIIMFHGAPGGRSWISSWDGRAAITAGRSGNDSCGRATWSSWPTIGAATGTR